MRECRGQAGHSWRQRLRRPISELNTEFVGKKYTSLVRLLSQSIIFVHSIQRNLFEGQSVTCKMAHIIPTHSVDVCLSYFVSKLGMVFGQKKVKVLVSNERSLLNYLCIDVW